MKRIVRLTESDLKKIIKRVILETKQESEDSFIDKTKAKYKNFLELAKSERDETYIAARIFLRYLNDKNSVTEDEKKFLAQQGKDVLRIATVVGLGSISMLIPLFLQKIIKKYNKDWTIFPSKSYDDKDEPN
jgi:hypothetical protein